MKTWIAAAAALVLVAACGSRKVTGSRDGGAAAADGGARAAVPVALPGRDDPRADLRVGSHRLDEHDSELGGEPLPEGRQIVECPLKDRLDVDAALDLAASRYDAGDFALALACADRAVRISPRSVEAHHNRGLALAALERWEEARHAFTHALAVDPDDPETLAGAADLYVNRVPPSREMTELGLEYARRGSAHAGGRRTDKELAARLALLEAQALDDLGLTDEALARVQAAVAFDDKSVDARYERAVILFHMCRFGDARQAFVELTGLAQDDPFVLYHLGLVIEREGRQEDADKLLVRAHKLAPQKFPDPAVLISAETFAKMVDKAVAELPPHLAKAVEGVTIEVADLPAMADLQAVDPPFSPTILGLYRGELGARAPRRGGKGDAAPLDGGGEPPSIVLYRKNLARAVGSVAELERQVRITLWHEIGHLRGADEDDLRARGLE